MDAETAMALHQLARKQMVLALMKDIAIDIRICKLEGWEYQGYINELKTEIDNIAERGTNGPSMGNSI